MKKTLFIAILTALSMNASAHSVVQKNPTLVGDTFGFVEGPVWDVDHQRFLFSDIPNHTTYSYDSNGELSVFDKNSGYANGLAIDSKGNLWAARHDRTLSYRQDNGEKVIIATSFKGKPLNSPNDLTIKSDDSIWFTDPPFGIQGYGPQKAKEEQPVRGIYRYSNGDLKLVSGESITNKTRFAIVKSPSISGIMADGIAVDQQGNVYVAGPGGVGVFNKEGKQLDYIAVDAGHISNVAIGGKNKDQLMVTAYNKVLLFKLK